MNKQSKIHEIAIKAARHYEAVSSCCMEYNSDVPKAIAYYYCDQIISAMIRNKKNWETILCEADIKYLYENGTPEQIKQMSFYVGPYCDPG